MKGEDGGHGGGWKIRFSGKHMWHIRQGHRNIGSNRRKGAIMIFGMTAYTFVHVVISLVGIGSGLIVLLGLLAANRLNGWTALFLISTIATCLTGFGFSFVQLLPSHIVGIITLVASAVAIFARYARRLAGAWRWIYVVGAVVALYLNVFVLIVQAFRKVPALNALAPTQTETPFKLVQGAVLVIFILLGIVAAIRFRPEPGR
jgi:hypothetical protein